MSKKEIDALKRRLHKLECIVNNVISTKVATQLMYYGSPVYMNENKKWVESVLLKKVEDAKQKPKEI